MSRQGARRISRRKSQQAKLALLILALIWLVILAARSTLQPDPPLAVLPPPAASDARRIRFPADQLPTIAMPDGEQEVVRSLLNVTRPMRYGDYEWNVRGVPQGPVWIRIDLKHQMLSVFRAGHEIGTAVILYGMGNHPTPIGLFHVKERQTFHWSRSYDAPMPYMLRLTDDGVAIHASNVREGYATHGCIGVPPDFARKLYAQVRRGDPVMIAADALPHGATGAKVPGPA